MPKFLWLVALLGALAGGVVLLLGFLFASGAPQEAAAAGLACGLAVIPYVLARAANEFFGSAPAPPRPLPPRRQP
jgi:hypothetical protein